MNTENDYDSELTVPGKHFSTIHEPKTPTRKSEVAAGVVQSRGTFTLPDDPEEVRRMFAADE